MELKTFLYIYTLSCNRCKLDVADVSEEEEAIIKNALNYCYMNEAGKKDILTSKGYCPVIDGVAELPEDIDSIISVIPPLSGLDKRIGNNIVTENTNITQYEVLYSVVREAMVNDTDIPEISTKYLYPMTTYAASAYYTYKKKTEMATILYQQYQLELDNAEAQHLDNYAIQNVYASFMAGDI